MVAWLSKAHHCRDKAAHWDAGNWPSYEERLDGRHRIAEAAAAGHAWADELLAYEFDPRGPEPPDAR